MRCLKSTLCLVLLCSSLASAEKESIPDYWPCPVGAEWNYKLESNMGQSTDVRTVVTEHTDASEVGWNIIQRTYLPQESTNYFLKIDGWVKACKTEMPPTSHTADFEKDKPELKYTALVAGDTWDYNGRLGGFEWNQNWKVVGPEKVTVPAGTFDAIRVDSSSTFMNFTTEYSFWYVDRVGPVRVLTEVAGRTSDMKLVKYTFLK